MATVMAARAVVLTEAASAAATLHKEESHLAAARDAVRVEADSVATALQARAAELEAREAVLVEQLSESERRRNENANTYKGSC